MGTQQKMSSSYHPPTDGQTERLNQCLESYLRCMTHEHPKNWHSWLPLTEWWYNTTFHTAIQMTPFEALYGYSPPSQVAALEQPSKVKGVNQFLAEKQNMLASLKLQLQKAKDRMKIQADKNRVEREFEVGEYVYLKLRPYRQISVKN